MTVIIGLGLEFDVMPAGHTQVQRRMLLRF